MEIEHTIAGFKVSWPDKLVNIQVKRLHDSMRGLSSEITITADLAGYPSPLHRAQFNFSSANSRETLCKLLSKKIDVLPWSDMLEEFCNAILDGYRQGEPLVVLEIDQGNPVHAPEYLLDPILLKGVPTIVFGEKGAAKSTVCLYFNMCLAMGSIDNPLGLGVPAQSITTLILDWEQEQEIVKYYAYRLAKGMDLPYFPLHYRHCAAPLVKDLPYIQEHIEKIGAEVIIIDSLGAACGGELKDASPALEFFGALRKLKVTSLIIAQTSKNPESKTKSIYGSTYFTYYARSIFELCKSDGNDRNDTHLGLFHRWANYSSLQSPIGMRIQYNGDAMTIEREEVNFSEFRERIDAQGLIIEALKTAGKLLAVAELHEITGVAEASIRPILTRLRNRKQVVNPERGLWGLGVQC